MTKELFSTLVGSRAFGLENPDSDYDVRTVYTQSAADLFSPFPMDRTEALGPEGGTFYGFEVEHQVLDYGTFLKKLVAQDLNAWVILMSNETETGWNRQQLLRELAVDHLLDSRKLLDSARRRASAMLTEARLKGSGKIAANGLAYLIFALNMGRIIPSPALNLGAHREELRAVKATNELFYAERILDRMIGAEQSFVREPDPEHSYVNRKFMDYYHKFAD